MILGQDPMPLVFLSILGIIGAVVWLGTQVIKRLERIAVAAEANVEQTKGAKNAFKKQTSGQLPVVIPVDNVVEYLKTSVSSGNDVSIASTPKRTNGARTLDAVDTGPVVSRSK